MIIAHYNLKLLSSSDPPTSASQVARTTDVSYHASLKKKFSRDVILLCCPGCSYVHLKFPEITFYFVKKESHSVPYSGVQWHNLSSLQSPPPGTSNSHASAS